jgi:hypothetical protein
MDLLGLKKSSRKVIVVYAISYFLSTFNTPYVCPNIRCDGWKNFAGGIKEGLNKMLHFIAWTKLPLHLDKFCKSHANIWEVFFPIIWKFCPKI